MARKRHYRKRSKQAAGLPLLVGMCLVALLGVGAFYSFSTSWTIGDLSDLLGKRKSNFGFLENLSAADRNFSMAGVSLGMSPSQIKQQHPRLSVATSADGNKKAHYFLDNASYSIWFVKERGKDKAYRMRINKSFNDWTEKKIMAVMGRTYGRPATANCTGKQISNSHRCQFSYLGKDGIALGVNIRTIKGPNKGSKVELTLDVIDTVLEGKRRRHRGSLGTPIKRTTNKPA